MKKLLNNLHHPIHPKWKFVLPSKRVEEGYFEYGNFETCYFKFKIKLFQKKKNKNGVKRGHSIPYHHQQSPPTPPHGGSYPISEFSISKLQFSNLNFSMSKFPYSKLVTFPSNTSTSFQKYVL